MSLPTKYGEEKGLEGRFTNDFEDSLGAAAAIVENEGPGTRMTIERTIKLPEDTKKKSRPKHHLQIVRQSEGERSSDNKERPVNNPPKSAPLKHSDERRKKTEQKTKRSKKSHRRTPSESVRQTDASLSSTKYPKDRRSDAVDTDQSALEFRVHKEPKHNSSKHTHVRHHHEHKTRNDCDEKPHATRENAKSMDYSPIHFAEASYQKKTASVIPPWSGDQEWTANFDSIDDFASPTKQAIDSKQEKRQMEQDLTAAIDKTYKGFKQPSLPLSFSNQLQYSPSTPPRRSDQIEVNAGIRKANGGTNSPEFVQSDTSAGSLSRQCSDRNAAASRTPVPAHQTQYPGAVWEGGEDDAGFLFDDDSIPSEPPRRQNSMIRITAHKVDDPPIAQVIEPFAVRVRESLLHPCGPRMRWVSLAAAILVVLAIVLGVVLLPSAEPIPTITVEDLVVLLSTKSLDNGTALGMPMTPQNDALTWFVESNGLGTLSDRRIIQRYALATLYFSTNGGNWTNNTGWLSDANECEWYFSAEEEPSCSSGGDIISLSLVTNNLRGTMPEEVAMLSNSLVDVLFRDEKLTGTIPSAIGLLTKLSRLQLGRCGFIGNLPFELFRLSELEDLSLSSNELQGGIPSNVGIMTKLESLVLDDNRFVGSIPSELGLLTRMTSLTIDNNNLLGVIATEMGLLTLLKYLSLDNNKNLAGTIPSEIYHLTSLSFLTLHESGLSGTIASDIGLLTSLKRFYLQNNIIAGTIPSEMGRLTDLIYLRVDENRFVGSIPSSIGRLTRLDEFRLYSNNFSGALPSEIGLMSSLSELGAASNKLLGTLVSEIGRLTGLKHLSLYANQLSGTIPSEIGFMTNLKILWLSFNKLNGTIPSEICLLPNLEELSLNGNNLMIGDCSCPDTVQCDL